MNVSQQTSHQHDTDPCTVHRLTTNRRTARPVLSDSPTGQSDKLIADGGRD